MGLQVREVQRRIAGVARTVLDGRSDRTPRLRHLGPSEIRGRWLDGIPEDRTVDSAVRVVLIFEFYLFRKL